MAKVTKFADGLKLFIRNKIMGLLLQDLDSMIKTFMAIKREVDNVQNIQDASVVKDKRMESQPSFGSGKKQKTSTPQGFQGHGRDYLGQG